MSLTSASRARRFANRIAATWADMDHAQRRMLEIQTGLTGLTRRHDRSPRPHQSGLDTQL